MRTGVKRCLAAAALSAVAAAAQVAIVHAEPALVYSQDWSEGSGGWFPIGGFHRAQRIEVGHPLAPFAYYFGGWCGMGFRGSTIPETRMRFDCLVYMLHSNHNGLSVNVRTADGVMIYKYSMGGGSRVDANCQPPNDYYRPTNIVYRTRQPYILSSYWFPGTARFALSLTDALTGEVQSTGRYICRSTAAPGMITFDQEGGQGPAVIGKVEVWLGE